MNSLVILLGPTGVGKTELSLRVAEHFGSPIISSDSRQLYKDLPIGTAAPTVEQMARVRHYMVGTLSLTDYYSASSFEEDVMSLLRELHQTHPTVVMTGGSMMYIDAVTKGIDDIPTVTPEIRTAIYKQFEEEGLSPILAELKETDPIHYNEVDRNNYKRVIHAVEICRMTGKPYSSFRTNTRKERPFRIIQIGLTRVIPLSAFRSQDFIQNYGLQIADGPMKGLLARAVIVVDKKGIVRHIQLVKEISQEPDYEAALERAATATTE